MHLGKYRSPNQQWWKIKHFSRQHSNSSTFQGLWEPRKSQGISSHGIDLVIWNIPVSAVRSPPALIFASRDSAMAASWGLLGLKLPHPYLENNNKYTNGRHSQGTTRSTSTTFLPDYDYKIQKIICLNQLQRAYLIRWYPAQRALPAMLTHGR